VKIPKAANLVNISPVSASGIKKITISVPDATPTGKYQYFSKTSLKFVDSSMCTLNNRSSSFEGV